MDIAHATRAPAARSCPAAPSACPRMPVRARTAGAGQESLAAKMRDFPATVILTMRKETNPRRHNPARPCSRLPAGWADWQRQTRNLVSPGVASAACDMRQCSCPRSPSQRRRPAPHIDHGPRPARESVFSAACPGARGPADRHPCSVPHTPKFLAARRAVIPSIPETEVLADGTHPEVPLWRAPARCRGAARE